MRALGWTVLTFVFVDELLVMAAFGVWGHHVQGWPLAVLMSVVAMLVWWSFASPKARYGGPVRRPLVKCAIFLLGSAALWHAGREDWAVALLGFSVVVNGLAQLPFVQAILADLERVEALRSPA